MNGTLIYKCLACHERITWRKVDFMRPDNYPDWRIVVSCKCGERGPGEYPWLYARAREAHDAQVGVELETQRRNVLDAALTKGGNLYFDILMEEKMEAKEMVLFNRIENENEQCAFWLISSIYKIKRFYPKMTMTCLSNILRDEMPRAHKAYLDYCKNT